MRENLAADLRLLLVTDDRFLAGRDPVALCRAAVRGGVSAVQLRLKHAADREVLALARELVRALDVPVFLNDRMDIALAAGAAGVHLGPDDLPPEMARRVAPAGFVIGASVGGEEEIARGAAADYWGIGPLRGSPTKADAGPALGREGVAAIARRSGPRPCVAIGGVQPEDVSGLIADGLAGVAVVSGILGADDAETAARGYLTPRPGRR